MIASNVESESFYCSFITAYYIASLQLISPRDFWVITLILWWQLFLLVHYHHKIQKCKKRDFKQKTEAKETCEAKKNWTTSEYKYIPPLTKRVLMFDKKDKLGIILNYVQVGDIGYVARVGVIVNWVSDITLLK